MYDTRCAVFCNLHKQFDKIEPCNKDQRSKRVRECAHTTHCSSKQAMFACWLPSPETNFETNHCSRNWGGGGCKLIFGFLNCRNYHIQKGNEPLVTPSVNQQSTHTHTHIQNNIITTVPTPRLAEMPWSQNKTNIHLHLR